VTDDHGQQGDPPEPPAETIPKVEPEPAKADSAAPAEPKPRPKRPPRNPHLLRAFRSGRPVEGTIVAVIKGGYEVKVDRSRGFCPHSHIDLHRVDDPEAKIGQTYSFRVTQVRRGGEEVVLSRRAVLEEQRVEEAKAVRATLVQGSLMQGRVASIVDFGAFVDLGAGVTGLAHVSELSHRRVERPSDAVSVGDRVQVKVLKLNDETGRISLSLRQAQDDPWVAIGSRFASGQTCSGVVRRIADFGAFVEIAPGVEALAPGSEFPPSPNGWKNELAVGTECEWLVLTVDASNRRMSLTLPGNAASDTAIEPEAELSGLIQRVEGFGVFVWLRPGKVGLVPREWLGLPREVDLRRRFAVGQPIEVRVVEVAEDGRRIRLARKGVKIVPEKRVVEEKGPWKQDPVSTKDAGSFGSILGDKLRAALGPKDSDS
jgi:small subunit ribosomal protein S1